jgi:4-hydroxybenzoate polyprenyltransferase
LVELGSLIFWVSFSQFNHLFLTMAKIKSYLVACHFGPTLLVTAVTFLLATSLWWEGPAFIIAFGIFLGQLIVGWTNDLYDFRDDLRHSRVKKPLVSGDLKPAELKRAVFIVLPIAIIVNLFGPLGLKAGSISILGIGIGVAYNFYLKPTAFSPIPYALAFALLPAALVISTDRTPPLWILWAGGLLGLSAHFANVLKDFNEDKASGIESLPIRLGRIPSRLIAATFLIAATIVLNSASTNTPILVIGIIAGTLSILAPRFILFKLLMLIALLDVILLVNAAGELIGSRTV